MGASTTSRFDVSGFAGVTDLTVNSSATTVGDFIKAAITQNVTDTNTGSGTNVSGGNNVTVTANGLNVMGITVAGAAGAVTTTDTDKAGTNSTAITGGTTVNATSYGNITVGDGTA